MRTLRRAGIEDLGFHDLHHEATTRLFERDLNIVEAASITGHKDPRMLRRYTHLKAQASSSWGHPVSSNSLRCGGARCGGRLVARAQPLSHPY